jgi:hypothetical protein
MNEIYKLDKITSLNDIEQFKVIVGRKKLLTTLNIEVIKSNLLMII